MKNTDVEKNLIPIPSKEVAMIKYPYDLGQEYKFVKNLKYEQEPNTEKATIEKSEDKFILFRPELKKLYNFLQSEVDFYVTNILGSEMKLRINSSWVQKQVKGSVLEKKKSVSIVNGCFYINIPDDKTPLSLETYNCLGVREDFFIDAESSDLVLWDNQLSHYLDENKNEETRYSVAFTTSYEEQFEFSLALVSAEKNPEEGITLVAQKNIMGEAPVSNINTKVKYIHSNKTGWHNQNQTR